MNYNSEQLRDAAELVEVGRLHVKFNSIKNKLL